MTIRVSAKLGRRIRVTPVMFMPADSNPLADWSAHLFVAGRVQHVIVANTASLYSMVMRGKGMVGESAFRAAVMEHMREFLRSEGFDLAFDRLIAPSASSVSLSKALNRAVTGSTNDLVANAKYQLVGRGVSPWETPQVLNQIPMSCLGYKSPGEAFLALVESGYAALKSGILGVQ